MAEKTQTPATPVIPTPSVTDSTQPVETNAYVPQYRVKNEFKAAILKAIGQYPFNQIAGIMNAINVEVMDHQTLTQVINVLGQFPYTQVADLLSSVNNYVDQILDED